MCVRICDEANGKKAAPRPPLHTMGRPFFPPPHAKYFVDLCRARFFSASCKSRPKKTHTQKVEGHKGMMGSVSHATDPVLVLLRPCTWACSLPFSAFHYTTPHTHTHKHARMAMAPTNRFRQGHRAATSPQSGLHGPWPGIVHPPPPCTHHNIERCTEEQQK